jgi:hypothetical protein
MTEDLKVETERGREEMQSSYGRRRRAAAAAAAAATLCKPTIALSPTLSQEQTSVV